MGPWAGDLDFRLSNSNISIRINIYIYKYADMNIYIDMTIMKTFKRSLERYVEDAILSHARLQLLDEMHLDELEPDAQSYGAGP